MVLGLAAWMLPARAQTPAALNGNVYQASFGPGDRIYLSTSFIGTDQQTYQGNLRLNPNGTIDTSFVPATTNPALSFGFLADGSFLVNGVSLITRYNANGTPLTSFEPIFASRALVVDDTGTSFYTGRGRYAADGTVLTNFGSEAIDALALAVDEQGRVLMGGTNGRLVRLNPDGSRDATFAPPPTLLGNGNVHGLAIDSEGDILVTGAEFGTDAHVFRLNSDGSLDTGFSAATALYGPAFSLSDGTTLIATGNNGTRISFDTAGRAISSGTLIRLNFDGSLHPIQPVTDFTFTGAAGFTVYQPVPREPAAEIHAADTNQSLRIRLAEVARVIELYNTRHQGIRTGAYRVQSGSEDGFAPDVTRAPGSTATLTRYHSADTHGATPDSPRDGAIDRSEMLRVIELYNYRQGALRTGEYHVDPRTSDGFAPGP